VLHIHLNTERIRRNKSSPLSYKERTTLQGHLSRPGKAKASLLGPAVPRADSRRPYSHRWLVLRPPFSLEVSGRTEEEEAKTLKSQPNPPIPLHGFAVI
jgi:hypothetical protein